jgi:hypothetical protein
MQSVEPSRPTLTFLFENLGLRERDVQMVDRKDTEIHGKL